MKTEQYLAGVETIKEHLQRSECKIKKLICGSR